MITKNKKIKNILKVPFFSQNDESVPVKWHDKSCAIACVSMMIGYLLKEVSIESLINEALAINAYTEHGWSHDGIVRLLRNHGVSAYTQEFRAVSVKFENEKPIFEESIYAREFVIKGILKIFENISQNFPVICSMKEGFEDNKTSHTILITGFVIDGENKTIIYHDPDSRNGERKENKSADISRFLEYWKGLAVFSD